MVVHPNKRVRITVRRKVGQVRLVLPNLPFLFHYLLNPLFHFVYVRLRGNDLYSGIDVSSLGIQLKVCLCVL